MERLQCEIVDLLGRKTCSREATAGTTPPCENPCAAEIDEYLAQKREELEKYVNHSDDQCTHRFL